MDRVRRFLQPAPLLSAGHVPEPHYAGAGDGDQHLPVRAEPQACDVLPWSGPLLCPGLARQPYGTTRVTARQVAAVRAQRQIENVAGVRHWPRASRLTPRKI